MSRFGLRTRPGLVTSTLLGNRSGFAPTSLPGLRLWLDADDVSTITASGSAVSKWTSKDTNSREFVQATSADQPTTGANTLNGKNVVTFDRDFLVSDDASSVWKFLHDGAKYTLFAVVRFDTETLNRMALIHNTGDGGNIGFGVIYDDRNVASRDHVIQHLVNNTQSNRAVINTSGNDFFVADQFALLRLTGDPGNATAANRSALRRNAGAAQSNNTQTGTPSDGDPSSALSIGAANGGNGEFMKGRIAEILVYERDMSAQEVEDVEDYLADKWGITLA